MFYLRPLRLDVKATIPVTELGWTRLSGFAERFQAEHFDLREDGKAFNAGAKAVEFDPTTPPLMSTLRRRNQPRASATLPEPAPGRRPQRACEVRLNDDLFNLEPSGFPPLIVRDVSGSSNT